MQYHIRDFRQEDAGQVNRVALAAYEQYRDAYSDWPLLAGRIAETASLAETGEMIVAVAGDRIAGVVIYVGSGRPKNEFFDIEWPVIRMLSVDPEFRGHGIGRALTEECIRRAERDNAPVIALHTTPMMQVALAMYERLGFTFKSEAPPLLGVPYGIYLKKLEVREEA